MTQRKTPYGRPAVSRSRPWRMKWLGSCCGEEDKYCFLLWHQIAPSCSKVILLEITLLALRATTGATTESALWHSSADHVSATFPFVSRWPGAGVWYIALFCRINFQFMLLLIYGNVYEPHRVVYVLPTCKTQASKTGVGFQSYSRRKSNETSGLWSPNWKNRIRAPLWCAESI